MAVQCEIVSDRDFVWHRLVDAIHEAPPAAAVIPWTLRAQRRDDGLLFIRVEAQDARTLDALLSGAGLSRGRP